MPHLIPCLIAGPRPAATGSQAPCQYEGAIYVIDFDQTSSFAPQHDIAPELPKWQIGPGRFAKTAMQRKGLPNLTFWQTT